MYITKKAVSIELSADEQESLNDAIADAGTDGDGNPVLELQDGDGDLIGSIVYHGGTKASELIDED